MVSAVGQAEFFLRVKQTLGRSTPPPADTGATNHHTARLCATFNNQTLISSATRRVCVCL